MDKEFKAQMNETVESEKAEKDAIDSKVINKVIEGRQEVFIKGYGTIIFDYPSAGLALEGDQLVTKFRTKHLRENDILTEAQLKAIYKQPITTKIGGKDVVIGNGEWPESYDNDLESLNHDISNCQIDFSMYRGEYQLCKTELEDLGDKKPKKKEQLQKKMEDHETKAYKSYTKILELKQKQLELNTLRARLFADSLEEQSFLEKVKFFAPSCIKQNKNDELVPLWEDLEAFEKDTFVATKIITLFNLFLRGLDISFFGDVPEGTTSS